MILAELELNNFKTYVRNHVIKIIGKFIVVTGPNGAGKSNFMDAVAFVMGAKAADLRVSKIEELVNSSASKTNGMFVKVVLRSENGDEHRFERSVERSRSRYYVNDNEVSFLEYETVLKTLNISIKLKNCLVFQNSVESIITKKPCEWTATFEEISGSGELKVEYDRLKDELSRCHNAQQMLLIEKRSLTRAIRNMQLYERDAKIYAELSKQKENAQVQLLLFNLYHLRRIIEKSISKELEFKEIIDKLGNEKYSTEEKLGRLEYDRQRYTENITKLSDICKAKELEMKESEKNLAIITEERDYFVDRVGRFSKSYESAKKADATRKSFVRDLENALKETERERVKYIQRYSKTLGRDVQLSDSQIEEYEDIKARVEAACAANNERLIILNNKYEALKDIYDHESTKLNEAATRFELTRDHRNNVISRIEEKEDFAKKLRTSLREKRATYDGLCEKFESSKQRKRQLEREIENINEELKDSKDDEIEMKRKKDEIVEKLKDRFSGVYKRLGELCRPIHNRYSIALTKVFGTNVDSVIVDDTKTALECIEYLKKNEIGICKFLPLDRLENCKLSEHLRDIRDPPSVKLIYDVVQFSPPEIGKAVFHATKNTLVCETPEDASRVAYGLSSRHDCVSIDGCYFRKSGIISGGSCDLARKAKRWDLEQRASLKSKKQNFTTELREIEKKAPKQSDLLDLAAAIKGIEWSLQHASKAISDYYKELSKIESELKILDESKEASEKNVTKAKFHMDEAHEALRELKAPNDAKERQMFADFCDRIGVDNIQNFEKEQMSYKKKIGEFDRQIDRINSLLSFESKDTKSELKRCERNLNAEKNQLKSIVERQTDVQSSLKKVSNELETLQSEYHNSVLVLGEIENKIFRQRNELNKMAKEYLSLVDKLNRIQLRIGEKKAAFFTLLTDAKINGFSILATTDQTPSNSQTSDFSTTNNTAFDSLTDIREIVALQIDFSSLPEELKNLDDSELDDRSEELEKIINERTEEMALIRDPEIRVSQQLFLQREKLNRTINELRENRTIVKNTTNAYNAVKTERCNRFMRFFDQVASRIDVIYKELTKNPSAQAYLVAENSEEPYLAGIQYACVVPGKQFHSIDNLSGGEKTMAALPLLFAIKSVDEKKPPFQIVDEIDAALDNRNVKNLVENIKRNGDNQTIVISHNKEFVAGADTIIGVTFTKTASGMESVILTFDLTLYPDRIRR